MFGGHGPAIYAGKSVLHRVAPQGGLIEANAVPEPEIGHHDGQEVIASRGGHAFVQQCFRPDRRAAMADNSVRWQAARHNAIPDVPCPSNGVGRTDNQRGWRFAIIACLTIIFADHLVLEAFRMGDIPVARAYHARAAFQFGTSWRESLSVSVR